MSKDPKRIALSLLARCALMLQAVPNSKVLAKVERQELRTTRILEALETRRNG